MSTDQKIVVGEPYTPAFKGFVKIWKTHKKSGEKTLLVQKDNLILSQGATLLAQVLAGTLNTGISTMYVGYNNNLTSFTPPVIDVGYSVPFKGFSGDFGYLRQPLAFSPTFLTSGEGYVNNTVIFTTMIASATKWGGADFTPGLSNIYECALVATPTGSDTTDIVFSRINFNQIQYDNTHAFTIAWGVQFLVT